MPAFHIPTCKWDNLKSIPDPKHGECQMKYYQAIDSVFVLWTPIEVVYTNVERENMGFLQICRRIENI